MRVSEDTHPIDWMLANLRRLAAVVVVGFAVLGAASGDVSVATVFWVSSFGVVVSSVPFVLFSLALWILAAFPHRERSLRIVSVSCGALAWVAMTPLFGVNVWTVGATAILGGVVGAVALLPPDWRLVRNPG